MAGVHCAETAIAGHELDVARHVARWQPDNHTAIVKAQTNPLVVNLLQGQNGAGIDPQIERADMYFGATAGRSGQHITAGQRPVKYGSLCCLGARILQLHRA